MGFKKNNLFFYGLIVFISLVGCRREGGKNSGDDGKKGDTIVIMKDTSIHEVNLFLENSHSMAAYFQELTAFNKKIDNIIVELELNKSFKGKVISNTISTTIEAYSTISEFRSDLDPTNETRIGIAKSSPLDSIVGKICKISHPNDINILITDGIISGSNEKLARYDKPKEGVYYNKAFVSNLQNNMRLQLNNYIDSFSIKIYAYYSEFNANWKNPYYTLSNSKKTGVFTSRPYYIILIAKPLLIRKFEEEIQGELSSPEESLEIGFSYPDLPIKLTGYLRAQKNCSVSNNEVTLAKDKKAYSFGILADLSELNESQKEEEYIKDNTRLFVNDRNFNDMDVEVYNLEDIPSDVFIDRREVKKEIKGSTHLIVLNINDYQTDMDDEISFRIKNNIDTWYEDWSSFDDLNIDLDDNKTFNFVYFVNGIIEAYGGKDESYLINENIEFKLK